MSYLSSRYVPNSPIDLTYLIFNRESIANSFNPLSLYLNLTPIPSLGVDPRFTKSPAHRRSAAQLLLSLDPYFRPI